MTSEGHPDHIVLAAEVAIERLRAELRVLEHAVDAYRRASELERDCAPHYEQTLINAIARVMGKQP